MKPASDDWQYSPDPVAEAALRAVRDDYPPQLPAGLARVESLLQRLGQPQHRLPPVFHVAGTNGKGSTLAFLQAIFTAAGATVHKFTSPHLVRFEERIVLQGETITPAQLTELMAVVRAAALPVSFFEFFTALALLAFSRQPAAALLLETGLGGLQDATNVLARPAAAILTRISYDHTHLLGESLPEIARQKAGILKPGCPVVVAPQTADVTALLLQAAAAQRAPAFLHGRDWTVSADEGAVVYASARHSFRLPPPALLGAHQVVNAGTAIAALEAAGRHDLLTPEILARAMQNVVWPGRLQQLRAGALAALLPPGWELWLDGAHNDSGAEVLLAQIAHWGGDKPLHLVTAYKQKKDIAAFYAPLAPWVAALRAVDFPVEAPMLPPAALCAALQPLGFAAPQPAENLESALRSLLFPSAPPGRILVTGSLYLVGHALRRNG